MEKISIKGENVKLRIILLSVILMLILTYNNSCKHQTKAPSEEDSTITDNEKYQKYDLGGGVELEMILIGPGSFMMGSDKEESDMKPVHKVKITKFYYMSKFEVTQAQYQAVMGINPSYFIGEGNLPVDSVIWDDCQDFLKKLNEKFPSNEFRLPTEVEWEYACRAGSTTEYYFGDSEGNLGEYAWYDSNSPKKTHPVGEKKPNAWGLYDMHGNVWEWCNDYYYDKYYESCPAEDPKGTENGSFHVLRGGSWGGGSGACSSAYRLIGNPPHWLYLILGFRIVCTFRNTLAQTQNEWITALSEADDLLLTKYASKSRDTAKKLAAEAEKNAATGDVELAISKYCMAVKILKEASAKALTMKNINNPSPIISRLEKAINNGEKFSAQDTLEELEKLIPSDSRMPNYRKKVAAMPLPEKCSHDLGNGIKMEFILIHPGSFMMGSDKGAEEDKPIHKVKITKPYYLGKFEVTQEQYRAIMGINPSHFRGEGNLPVDSLSWDDCRDFLKMMNEKIPGKNFRLPTEAEWEYACRAGSTTEYCFGDSENDLGEYAWYDSNSNNKTHPVGEKKPNDWGLYDMHGNIWEWCNDYFGDKYYESCPAEDPKGAESGSIRVLRGGAWIGIPCDCRSAERSGFNPTYLVVTYVGFRVVYPCR